MEMIQGATQFLFQALQSDPGLRNDILKLRATLPMSWLLVERSECWRFKHKAIDVLLPQIKDAAYEAQGLLDEFSYQELKQRVEGPQRSFPGAFVSSSVTNFRNWWSGYPAKVKAAQEMLEYLYVKLKETCDGFGVPENPNQFSNTARPVTSSHITEYLAVIKNSMR